jgi:hypothetical protein
VNRLRPHPHRGDVIAAGAVPLAIAGYLIELRMRQWSLGPRFVVIAAIGGLILAMGWLAPLEGPGPRAYHSILLIAGLLSLLVAFELLAEVLGARRPPGAGATAWTLAAEAALAVGAARRAHSAACTLIAALAGVIAVEAFVSWVFHPRGLGTFRAMLLVLALGYAVGAVRLRDRHRRHAVALVNAAGIVTLVLALSWLLVALVSGALSRTGAGSVLAGPASASASFGWKLYLLAIGCGLIAYAGADRERGPAYLGVAVLAAFVLLAGVPVSGRGSLLGWPLFLLVLGAAGLTIGLRPRRPLPPEPATVPLHDAGRERPS